VTRDDDASESPHAELYLIATIVGVAVCLRVSTGRDTIGVEAACGVLALVVALARCALFRRGAALGAGVRRSAIARAARQITPPALLAFPAAVAASGSWAHAFGDRPQNVNVWIGALAYLLALLELTQLRVWQLNADT
jgi:hypothetical protein